MLKNKRKKEVTPKNHFRIALGIFILLLSIMVVGRLGQTTYIALFLSFILGDFSTVVIVFICYYVFKDLLMNKNTNPNTYT